MSRECSPIKFPNAPFYIITNVYTLSINSLQHRRTVCDIATMHSVVSGRLAISLSPHLCFMPPSVTRGHNLKLMAPFVHLISTCQNFVSRTSTQWNKLSNTLLSAVPTSSLRTRVRLFKDIMDPFKKN